MTADAQGVRYTLVASVVVVTLHWESRVYRPAGRVGRVVCGLPHTLFTLLFGWWGVPWGPLRTAQAVVRNLSGGRVEPSQAWGNHA